MRSEAAAVPKTPWKWRSKSPTSGPPDCTLLRADPTPDTLSTRSPLTVRELDTLRRRR